MTHDPTISELTQRNVATVAAMERASDEHRTIGDWVADLVAFTVGSWAFIILQSALLAAWIVANLFGYAWDPYPFILLNLMLSFQAAYASPIIMMSQNRQARLNERRNKLDLQINLLAEQESTEMLKLLRLLCEKLEIDIAKDDAEKALEQATHPEELIQQIDGAAAEKLKRTGKNASSPRTS